MKCDSAMRKHDVTRSDLLPIGEKEKLKVTSANEDGESQTMEHKYNAPHSYVTTARCLYSAAIAEVVASLYDLHHVRLNTED